MAATLRWNVYVGLAWIQIAGFPSGMAHRRRHSNKTGSLEDIMTRDQFGNFELAFDWKLDTGGNAGVFYHATEEYDHIYWSAPEYQLLDDANHPDGKNRLTSAGADYAVYPPPAGVVKPANQWNSSLIVVQDRAFSIGSTDKSFSNTSCGVPTGRQKSRRASSRTGPITVSPKADTLGFRATTTASSGCATSASVRFREWLRI